MGGLEGRTAIVTGASSGIGLATARLLAERGATAHGVARRRRDGEPFQSHSLDVRDRAAIERFVGTLARIDILVYAAGTNLPERRLEQLTAAAWDELVDVNLSGAFHFIRACLPQLRETQGDVVLIASVSGQWPDLSGPAYQASKAGMIALARAAAFEEHANGIRFSSVNPGLVDTPLLDRRPVPPPREVLDLALRPEDVAEAVAFVVSLPSRVHVPELSVVPRALQSLGKTATSTPPQR
jgi:NAD(P)-dependent dehydrogenase (short-subunit alcohol dehydrogenase family)